MGKIPTCSQTDFYDNKSKDKSPVFQIPTPPLLKVQHKQQELGLEEDLLFIHDVNNQETTGKVNN